MLVVNLQGGLGNQMFQYAAARGIAGGDKAVFLDHHNLEENNTDTEHFTARKYELGIFKNLKALKASPSQLSLFTGPGIYNKILRVFLNARIIKQQENEYIPPPDRPKSNYIYLNGYFQSEKYFQHLRNQLLTEFSFPSFDIINEDLKNQILTADNPVSIHIRRGDYLKSPLIFDVHGVLPLGYYEQAIDTLKSKYPNITFFIFSDDIDWCRANLNTSGIDIHFVAGNDAGNHWKDMALMSLCKHHIIANSSYSWWGAWLSTNNGDIFAPDRWLNPLKVNFNINNFIPANWTILTIE